MISDIPFSVILDMLIAFKYNLFIAILAMFFGCTIGLVFAYCSILNIKMLSFSLRSIRSVFRNVPSFVLLFYFTLIMPTEIEFLSVRFTITPIGKSILALSIPVAGYYNEVFEAFLKESKAISIAAFKQFFMVILMASTTASVIGVSEVMAVANTYIATEGNADLILEIYLVLVVLFVLFGLLINSIFYQCENIVGKFKAYSRNTI